MTVNPILRDITMKEWGLDGIICTDAGSLRNMVNPQLHNYYKTNAEGLAGAVKAGINQFLENATLYRPAAQEALQKGLLTEKDIDDVIKGEFRDMIRLGLLDPPEMVKYASIKGDEEVWKLPEHKAIALRVAQESVVLLKNANNFLPLKKESLKSIAVLGPLADVVALDWYSGTPGYVITPVEGIRNKVGSGITVNFVPKDADAATAVEAARKSDVAVVFVGNHPTCDAGWAKCPTPSDGKEAIDRKAINLEQEEFVKQIYAANPKTVVVLLASFPDCDQLEPGECSSHPPYHAQCPGGRHGDRRRPVRRHQSGRPPGTDLAEIARPGSAHDGLQHPPRPDVHVFQG
jgi:beta-glucosidase